MKTMPKQIEPMSVTDFVECIRRAVVMAANDSFGDAPHEIRRVTRELISAVDGERSAEIHRLNREVERLRSALAELAASKIVPEAKSRKHKNIQ